MHADAAHHLHSTFWSACTVAILQPIGLESGCQSVVLISPCWYDGSLYTASSLHSSSKSVAASCAAFVAVPQGQTVYTPTTCNQAQYTQHSSQNPAAQSHQRTLPCAGVAAGFNAPISGVFFAVETVLQAQGSDLRRNSADTTPGLTIAMVLLASVLAAIVSQAGLGQAPAVRVPDYQLQSILELPLILGFGACCGAVSASFAYSNQVLSACALTVLRQANLNLVLFLLDVQMSRKDSSKI